MPNLLKKHVLFREHQHGGNQNLWGSQNPFWECILFSGWDGRERPIELRLRYWITDPSATLDVTSDWRYARHLDYYKVGAAALSEIITAMREQLAEVGEALQVDPTIIGDVGESRVAKWGRLWTLVLASESRVLDGSGSEGGDIDDREYVLVNPRDVLAGL